MSSNKGTRIKSYTRNNSWLSSKYPAACGGDLYSAFEQIQQHPTVWRILKGRFRRYLLQRFPYGIIYAVEGKVIYIAAVMHLKRKPGYWVSRGKA